MLFVLLECYVYFVCFGGGYWCSGDCLISDDVWCLVFLVWVLLELVYAGLGIVCLDVLLNACCFIFLVCVLVICFVDVGFVVVVLLAGVWCILFVVFGLRLLNLWLDCLCLFYFCVCIICILSLCIGCLLVELSFYNSVVSGCIDCHLCDCMLFCLILVLIFGVFVSVIWLLFRMFILECMLCNLGWLFVVMLFCVCF